MQSKQMGHAISAIVFAGDADSAAVAEYDAKLFDCLDGYSLVALESSYVDAWAERLDISGPYADIPVLNFCVVHHIADALASGRPFAIIETDYFGGRGTQAAAVYHGDSEILAPKRARSGAINEALRALGVDRGEHYDEFEAFGLTTTRGWRSTFESYWEQ